VNESGALMDILRANLLSPIPLAFALATWMAG